MREETRNRMDGWMNKVQRRQEENRKADKDGGGA